MVNSVGVPLQSLISVCSLSFGLILKSQIGPRFQLAVDPLNKNPNESMHLCIFLDLCLCLGLLVSLIFHLKKTSKLKCVLDSRHKSEKWASLLNKTVNHACLFLEFLRVFFFFAKWFILVTHVVWIKFNFMQFKSIYSICRDSMTPETGKNWAGPDSGKGTPRFIIGDVSLEM